MINNRFENQAEIYQALLDGKKITQEWLPKGYYIHLKEGLLVDDVGKFVTLSFSDYAVWSIYQEPRKVTKHYRWLCKNENGFFVDDYYYDENPEFGIKRLDDDFILVDEDGNLVEKEQA